MANTVNASESSIRGNLLYGGISTAEPFEKRPLEKVNGGGHVLKYKRRKANVNRQFPHGCGHYALRSNVKPSGVSLGVGQDSGLKTDERGELRCVTPSGSSVEPGTLDVDKISIIPKSPKSLISETTESLEILAKLEKPQHIKPMEIPKISDIEKVNPPTTLEHESSHMSKTELLVPMKTLDECVSVGLLENASKPEEKEPFGVQLTIDMVSSGQLQISDPPTSPVVAAAEGTRGSLRGKYPPRKRISACRDIPKGCIRISPRLKREECQESVVSSSDRSAVNVLREEHHERLVNEKEQIVGDDDKQMREEVQDGDALKSKLADINTKESRDEVRAEGEVKKGTMEHIHVRVPSESRLNQDTMKNSNRSPPESNMSQSGLKPSSAKKFDREVENSGVKLVEESAKLHTETSLKREFPGNSVDECHAINQSQMKENFDLGSSNERVIVQGLMAAPNCLWRQGKRSFKSPSNPTHPSTGSQAKKQELMMLDGTKFISKKKKDETENPEGKSMDETMSPTRKVAYEGGSQLVLKENVDFPGYDDENDNRYLVKKSQNMALSLIPYGFHSLADEDQSQAKENVGLGSSNERVVVQGLMAAAKCLWRQGKRGFKSTSSLTQSTARSKAKKQKLMVLDDTKSISNKNKDAAENSERKFMKKKMFPPRQVAHEGGSQPVANDEVDFPGDNGEDDKCSFSKTSQGLMAAPRPLTDEDQCQVKENVGLGSSNERVVVQGLMAAPNCLWMQGKRAFTSSSSLSHSTARSKAKKQEVMVRDSTKSISKRRKDEPENAVWKSTRRKMSPTRKVAHKGGSHLVLKDEDDFPGDDDEVEKLSLVKKSQGMALSLFPCGLHSLADEVDDTEAVITRKKVRETLRLFQAICRKLMQEEEAKSKEGQVSKRFDLLARAILKKELKLVNSGKPIVGSVPGVEVGDEFHYRVELNIVGLHRPFQSGIDYVRDGNMAISIVASGGYADEMDSSDILKYSGQGGNPTGPDKKAEDQKLVRGNLALKNSMDKRTPVRVIRGFKENGGSDPRDARGRVTTTYTYDGLYLVEQYWQEKGRYGANIFMFQLRRIPGQPDLALKEVKKSERAKVREGLCVSDISEGKEKLKICAVNTIDNEKPPPFQYVTNIIYPSWYNRTPPRGCDCTDGCSDSEKCLCAVRNGGEIPFNYDGAIVEAKHLVYECGPLCKCPPSCHNRVSQHGIKFPLEIFKTESRGWGVRSLASISSGSFICEYTGELLQDKEAEERTGNDEYLFDIGNNYNDPFWEGLSTVMPSDAKTSSSCESVEDADFTIDAAQYGSIGRFVNHSCSPNLYAQNVLYDHDDRRMPHIMLFAAENIPPLQELTYHYNYQLDQVRDSDGNVKRKDCYCGSEECTGRLY